MKVVEKAMRQRTTDHQLSARKLKEMQDHPEWHQSYCCDETMHPRHNPCESVELNAVTARALGFSETERRTRVTPSLLIEICARNAHKQVGGALFANSAM
jgi:hypothetical protein